MTLSELLDSLLLQVTENSFGIKEQTDHDSNMDQAFYRT